MIGKKVIEQIIERYDAERGPSLRQTLRTDDGVLRTYYAGFDLSDLAAHITAELNSAAVADSDG